LNKIIIGQKLYRDFYQNSIEILQKTSKFCFWKMTKSNHMQNFAFGPANRTAHGLRLLACARAENWPSTAQLPTAAAALSPARLAHAAALPSKNGSGAAQ
jgi:hypothetical protein